jgi:hypothetical protein
VSNARKTDMNWAQVRDRIDRGETSDKMAAEDPAIAGLGTDAEAGGSSTDCEHITRSAADEQARPAARVAAQGAAQGGTVMRPRRALLGMALGAIAVVCLVMAVALALAP